MIVCIGVLFVISQAGFVSLPFTVFLYIKLTDLDCVV